MGRPKRNKPYNPALADYQRKQAEAAEADRRDRKAKDINRGQRGHVKPIEVDNPVEEGGRIVVMRSTRDDPLGDHHARNTISEAQYQAGRAFQEDFERAGGGVKGIELREWVDGGQIAEPLTEGQRKAAKRLARVHRELGINGSAIVHDVLVHCRTMKQIAASRQILGRSWEEYFGRRFRECLDTMAVLYGFSMK